MQRNSDFITVPKNNASDVDLSSKIFQSDCYPFSCSTPISSRRLNIDNEEDSEVFLKDISFQSNDVAFITSSTFVVSPKKVGSAVQKPVQDVDESDDDVERNEGPHEDSETFCKLFPSPNIFNSTFTVPASSCVKSVCKEFSKRTTALEKIKLKEVKKSRIMFAESKVLPRRKLTKAFTDYQLKRPSQKNMCNELVLVEDTASMGECQLPSINGNFNSLWKGNNNMFADICCNIQPSWVSCFDHEDDNDEPEGDIYEEQHFNVQNCNYNLLVNFQSDFTLNRMLIADTLVQFSKLWNRIQYENGDSKTNIITDTEHDELKQGTALGINGYLYGLEYRRFLPVVAGFLTPACPMSIKAKILATKDPFIIARLAKSVRDKTPSRELPSQEYSYKEVTKMGGSNSRFISVNRVLPISEDSHSNRNLQRLLRNGQREAYKRSWRQDKRISSYETSIKAPLRTDRIRPKVPKRGTYIKNRTKLTEDKETSGESEKENKVSLTVSNSDSSQPLLPLRSDSLPPDGDSLRSDEQKSLVNSENVQNKCLTCSEIQQRLTKANTEKGVLSVCLEKAQSELTAAQKKIKELDFKLNDGLKNDEYSMENLKDLEAEMCQLQKDKAILLHELHVTRKQLTRVMDQCDASDSSHVSSVYVLGSGKDSDDEFRSLGTEDQDDDWQQVKKQLDSANVELQRLRDVETRNEELESSIRHCEDRIIELQEQLKFTEVQKRDASAQTLRKDGTFTRQQPSDKTKIPKRLFGGSPSSLPMIPDPGSNIQRFRLGTSSLSRAEMLQKNLSVKEKEISILKSTLATLEKELDERKGLGDWSQTARMRDLKIENDKLKEELKIVKENYHKEMVMRKKYFNLTEEMKGKIRVFCRIKPREQFRKNSLCLEVPDEYSVNVTTQRGTYEFTFDSVFASGHTQDDVFHDVQSLVQSALDGYNVCIFAYGQTGSGKTYTLVGTESQPGIGPRAFRRIFDLVHENQSELDFRICASFFELYNDSLIDLLKNVSDDKLKIRRDHYGLVYVQGSELREVESDWQLLNLFNEACKNRHVSATRMNTESSRSHLIVTILIESTNKITGTVLKGKLSLVDLAGSERVGKTAAVAGQLKEANSINKSLSALGDVIAALSSEQQHVPYRNNKLTLLMQDSLGSNAKTLMFVTVSSSELNAEESLSSLTYASRVKQITNAATRMAESKEIARLRSIIMKLSKEEKLNGRS